MTSHQPQSYPDRPAATSSEESRRHGHAARAQHAFDIEESVEQDAWTRLNEHSVQSSPFPCACCASCSADRNENRCLRFLWTFAQIVIVIIAISCAAITFHTNPALRTTKPLLFWYLIGTLIGELCLLIVTAVMLLGLRLFVGPYNVHHANAMCAVQMKCWQGALYYVTLFIGAYLLVHSFPLNNKEVPIAAVVFVTLETVLSLVYVLLSCSVVIGILRYMGHKIESKMRRQPIVRFQVPYDRQPLVPAYATASLDQYAAHLARMSNRTAHMGENSGNEANVVSGTILSPASAQRQEGYTKLSTRTV